MLWGAIHPNSIALSSAAPDEILKNLTVFFALATSRLISARYKNWTAKTLGKNPLD